MEWSASTGIKAKGMSLRLLAFQSAAVVRKLGKSLVDDESA
jgi:hypothetical protein